MTEAEETLFKMQRSLEDADRVMKAIDEAVTAGWLNPRCTIADARLNYGNPFNYDWTTKEKSETT